MGEPAEAHPGDRAVKASARELGDGVSCEELLIEGLRALDLIDADSLGRTGGQFVRYRALIRRLVALAEAVDPESSGGAWALLSG